jgi:hypothetical protein
LGAFDAAKLRRVPVWTMRKSGKIVFPSACRERPRQETGRVDQVILNNSR